MVERQFAVRRRCRALASSTESVAGEQGSRQLAPRRRLGQRLRRRRPTRGIRTPTASPPPGPSRVPGPVHPYCDRPSGHGFAQRARGSASRSRPPTRRSAWCRTRTAPAPRFHAVCPRRHHVNGTVTLSGLSSIWSWTVLGRPPVTIDPPPTAEPERQRDHDQRWTRGGAHRQRNGRASDPGPAPFPAVRASPIPGPPLHRGLDDELHRHLARRLHRGRDRQRRRLDSLPATITISVAPAAREPAAAPRPLVTPSRLTCSARRATLAQVSARGLRRSAPTAAGTLQFARGHRGAPTSFSFSRVIAGRAAVLYGYRRGYRLARAATDASGNVSRRRASRSSSRRCFAILSNCRRAMATRTASIATTNDPTTHPGQPPECDGLKDRNCDGVITDATTCDCRSGWPSASRKATATITTLPSTPVLSSCATA